MFSFLPTRGILLQLLLLFVSTYIIYRLTKFYITKRRHDCLALSLGCKPPKRWKSLDPIFGLDFIYEQYKALKAGNVIEVGAGRFDKLGCRTASFHVVGLNVIGTIEPANIQTVLATDFSSWCLPNERKYHLTDFLGEGIFTTDGEAWKHSREMIRPSFARNRIEDVESNLEKHCQRLIDCIQPGEEVNLQPLFFAFTMDVATEFLFGECSDTLLRMRQRMNGEKVGTKDATNGKEGNTTAESGEVTVEEFVEAFTYAQAAAEHAADDDQSQWLRVLFLFLPNSKIKRSHKIIHSYIDAIVSRALATHPPSFQPPQSPNFLTTLLTSTRNPLKLRAELLNTLLAARDTTASLLSNAWFELSRRPALQRRLRRSIACTLSLPPPSSATKTKTKIDPLVLPTRPPTFTELKNIPYLTALFKESLRLYPVVPANVRQAARDTTLPLGGGEEGKDPVFVPRGTLVHWVLWGMHRREDLFGADAGGWRVGRWLDWCGPAGSGEEDEDGEWLGAVRNKEDEAAAEKHGGEDTQQEEEDKHSGSNASHTPLRKGLRPTWEFLPFNGGPRICVGQQFALAEAGYVTVRLLQAFSSMEPRGEGVWRERIGLTMTGRGGARVVLGV